MGQVLLKGLRHFFETPWKFSPEGCYKILSLSPHSLSLVLYFPCALTIVTHHVLQPRGPHHSCSVQALKSPKLRAKFNSFPGKVNLFQVVTRYKLAQYDAYLRRGERVGTQACDLNRPDIKKRSGEGQKHPKWLHGGRGNWG